MESIILKFMKKSIEIAQKNENIFVGVLAISSNNKIICSNEKQDTNDWVKYILHELELLKVNNLDSLYLTINTYTNNEFDLNTVLNYIKINKIFIGLPDPKLKMYLADDPILHFNNVQFYPDDLQKAIISQNASLFIESHQNIKNNNYYSQKRISELVKNNLCELGYYITEIDISNNKSVSKLSQFLTDNYHLSFDKSKCIVEKCLSDAFNNKYSSYDYKNDARYLNSMWSSTFNSICNKIGLNLRDDNIINVGVGSGNEAAKIFSTCKRITFVDIALDGLKKIKKFMPQSAIILSSAENISTVEDNTFDAYISLRTYNSSFFNISNALKEAERVLKNNSYILISIANGFIDSNFEIIPGLIIPNTEFVNIYRGLDTIRKLADELLLLGFIDIKYLPTTEEIYLFAKLKK